MQLNYVDDQNVRRTTDCYDDGESKGLLKLAVELNLHIPQNYKLSDLKVIVSEHAAFENVSKTRFKLIINQNVHGSF